MRRRRLAVLAAMLLSTLGACATATPAPTLEVASGATAADGQRTFDQILERFAAVYLEPAAIDPVAMLDGGVAALDAAVPELATRVDGDATELEMGGRRVLVRRQAHQIDGLAAALRAATAWVEGNGTATQPLEMQAAVLGGAVRSVDRWGAVLEGQRKDAMLDRFRGTMAGIGCRVGRRGNAVRVLEVYRGAPADLAGLRPGDRLVAVDGAAVEGWKISEVVARMRGEEGSAVTLRIAREEEMDVAITRARFVVPTVSSRMIGGDVGVLRITHVAKNSGFAVARVLGGLLEAKSLKGVVLDLRGNTGGSMLAAGQIADQFVDRGVLIETRGRDGGPVDGLRHRIDATEKGARRQLPLVVLVDSQTGSSAEFLAAALLAHDRAILVGEPTYGKTLLQKTYDFGVARELLLKVTVARAYAGGAPIPAGGLVPDVVLRSTEGTDGSVSCDAGAQNDSAVATVALPDGREADAELAFAVELLSRHAMLSRRDWRDSLRRDLCADARSAAHRGRSAAAGG